MTLTVIERDVLTLLQKLPLSQQHAVLAIVRALATPHGTPGITLLPFGGSIPSDDLAAMAAAIDQDCEQVNLDEW
jgi:hypothetical protein